MHAVNDDSAFCVPQKNTFSSFVDENDVTLL